MGDNLVSGTSQKEKFAYHLSQITKSDKNDNNVLSPVQEEFSRDDSQLLTDEKRRHVSCSVLINDNVPFKMFQKKRFSIFLRHFIHQLKNFSLCSKLTMSLLTVGRMICFFLGFYSFQVQLLCFVPSSDLHSNFWYSLFFIIVHCSNFLMVSSSERLWGTTS